MKKYDFVYGIIGLLSTLYYTVFSFTSSYGILSFQIQAKSPLLDLFLLDLLEIIVGFMVFIFTIKATYKLPRKFGRSKFSSISYILFSPICLPVLGFEKSEYSTNINSKKNPEVDSNHIKSIQTFSYEDAKAMMCEINTPIHGNLDTSLTNQQSNGDMIQQPAEPNDNQQNNKTQ